jgi:hypothetical protein
MTYFVDQSGHVVIVSSSSTQAINHARRTALNASKGCDTKTR